MENKYEIDIEKLEKVIHSFKGTLDTLVKETQEEHLRHIKIMTKCLVDVSKEIHELYECIKQNGGEK